MLDPKITEALALDAERRVPLATTQDERDTWLRLSDQWWRLTIAIEDGLAT